MILRSLDAQLLPQRHFYTADVAVRIELDVMNRDLLPRVTALFSDARTDEQGAHLLSELAAERQCTIETLLDRVAEEVVRGFDGGEVSYEAAISVMSAVHSAMLSRGPLYKATCESYAAKVYWALDEGEYGVTNDGGLDPIATRVRPAIKHLLRDSSARNVT